MIFRRWAEAELSLWQDFALSDDDLRAEMTGLTAMLPWVFCIRIAGTRVTADEKWQGSEAEPGGVHHGLVNRVRDYCALIESSLVAFGVAGTTEFLLDVADMRHQVENIPTFCFQRSDGHRSLLLPDPDFLSHDFYVDDTYSDTTSFEHKYNAGIFVGSTTGPIPLTLENIEAGAHERIRAALFFNRHPAVRFDLPSLVQCESEDLREYILKLGIGGKFATWQEQLQYRYQLSLDGNGATCSRVYLSLSSNSVLLKYQSPHQLHYFRDLQANEHYVPIRVDEEVIEHINRGAIDPSPYRKISIKAQTFAATRLQRIHIMRYVAELMQGYIHRFGKLNRRISNAPPMMFDVALHISNVGTVWGDPTNWNAHGSGNPIEAFRLTAGCEIEASDLQYEGCDAQGKSVQAVISSQWCGVRAQGQALYGLKVSLKGASEREFLLLYQARFVDGWCSAFCTQGTMVNHSSPLNGFRMLLVPR